MFGKVGNDQCRLTMNGNIAIKTSNGYKTYNVAKKRLTNVSSFCFDAGDFFFVMPTSKVKVGDIILVDKKPKCVIKVEDECISVIDYESSEIRQVVPERHVFMGSTYFYGKIVSMLGSGSMKGKGIMGKMMNMMLIKSMMKGSDGSNNMGGLGQLMMLQAMMGNGGMFGGDGLNFENMFDLQFDEDDEDLADVESDDEEDEPVKPKKAKKKA